MVTFFLFFFIFNLIHRHCALNYVYKKAATVAARAAMEVEDMAATKIPASYLNERLSHKPAAKPFNPQRAVLSILQH